MFRSYISVLGLAATAGLFALLGARLLPSAQTVKSAERLIAFPIPFKMFPLDEAVTPGEYAQLNPVIQTDWEREHAREEKESGIESGPNFDDIRAAHIPMGALGESTVIYFNNFPECSATGNCPMAIYVHEAEGYRRVIDTGGWGVAPLVSKGGVPDLAFYWHMSAGEQDSNVFHYTDGQFGKAGTVECTGASESDPVCAAMASATTTFSSVSLGEYKELRPAFEADLKKRSLAGNAYASFEVHAVVVMNLNQEAITAVESEPCDSEHNCRISIYVHAHGMGYLPLLLGASGWSASDIRSRPGFGIVIARHLSASQVELTKYPLNLAALRGQGKLLPEACEDITARGKAWPAKWDPAAFSVQPVACSDTP